ncbi:MAG: acyl-CoA dehydrogenase family protein [Candidatus Binatia bacterium]
MNFDFTDDQKMLKETAAGFLKDHCPLDLCRAVLESDQPTSAELWKKTAELGWQGTAIPEQYGGAGFGRLELAVMAEELGGALAPIPFSSSVYLATEAILLAGSEQQKKHYLPKLASGESIGTFAFSERVGQNGLEHIETTLAADSISGMKLPVADGDIADFAIVAARSDSGPSLALVDLGASGVIRTSLESFDPTRSMAKLELTDVPAEPLGEGGKGAEIANCVFNRAAVLMAFEQVGSASRALDLTRQYALERYAFGRPIGSFQAVKHTLADRWCDIEIARSNSYYGAWALEHDNAELPVAACLARVAASEAFDQMGIDMIQLHGGVGFTWEFDCHMFYRRAKVLSTALGNTASWKHKLVDRIAAQEAA